MADAREDDEGSGELVKRAKRREYILLQQELLCTTEVLGKHALKHPGIGLIAVRSCMDWRRRCKIT